MFKRVGQFTANRPDGKPETILIFQQIIDGSDLQGPHQSGGGKKLTTASGVAVNKTGEGKYEILEFDPVPLTSSDPNAI